MNILDQIKQKDEVKSEYSPPEDKSKKNDLLLLIAGCFSVLFSMSVILQFYSNSENSIYLVIGLGAFLLPVLIFNERYKVRSIIGIAQYYKEYKRLTIIKVFIPLVTVLISLTSVYGLYTGLDTMIDIKEASNTKDPRILLIDHQIDSLNRVQNFTLDSIVKASNPFIKENVDRLSKEIDQLNRRQIEDKKILLEKLEEQDDKLTDLKKELSTDIRNEIKGLQLEKDKILSIGNKSTDNAGVLKIALALLAFITELVIIGTAMSKGFDLYQYTREKSNYDLEYNSEIEKTRKELLEKPHVKRLVEYINVLEMIYSLNYEEITKKNIETVTALRGKKYTPKEVTEFRTLLLELGILSKHGNHRTSLDVTLEESKLRLDNFFSKIK